MRYGHLLAGILLLIFLFFLGLLLLAPPVKKIGVGGPDRVVVSNDKSQEPAEKYYDKPQFSSVTRVVYTDGGFEPASVSIPSGGTVAFENRSSGPFWPASGPSLIYPVPGSCGQSIFDPCAPVPVGVSWTLKFDKTGSWTYYDILSPGRKGTVVVQ